MTVFFCAVTSAFYDDDIYGDQLPKDAIEISEDLRQALLEAQSSGKQITAGKNGQPTAVDPPGLNVEQQVQRERFWRDSELARTDMLVARHRDELDAGRIPTLTDEQYRQLQSYRLALRDWPEQIGFPDELLRPEVPQIA
ncbi:phage tail assembly chaperone [Pseudomonas sp. WS 5146]|uniref:phage tail assembly chaperone n=1 Tax=Pseudomonas sp. WS 5146 TaxID=2717494 RepID=UPI001473420A|nr:phage tail assembly chaperone [Pseudomonas sp. WS 5146]NMX55253.1 phage tail protein [Pseudomonas sp. WS 5146]